MFTEVVAVNGIFYGVVVSAIVAMLSLTVFTGNVIVALLAVISITGNLATMLALYALWGWTLGAVEAISVSILVGLSVDYCFHLAEAYAISLKSTRAARVVDAMTHMGVSVLSGAFTTAASAFFLLFCEIQIFHRFGVILVVNTFFSLVYTFFFFCAMLALCGPVGKIGDVAVCCSAFQRAIGINAHKSSDTTLQLEYDEDLDSLMAQDDEEGSLKTRTTSSEDDVPQVVTID